MCILYTSDQYHMTDNLAVIFSTDYQQAHFCTDKPRWPVPVSISSILLLVCIPKPVSNCRQTPGCQNFLKNNFTPYLTFPSNVRIQNVSLNVCFIFNLNFCFTMVFFCLFFFTSYSPEYDTSLNIVCNLIPLHMVPISNYFICMSSLKSVTFCVVDNWLFESSFHTD